MLAAAFELPKEIVLDLPVINMTGNEQVSIENYKGIIEYTSERVRIRTSCGVLKISGARLVLKHIMAETVVVAGNIGFVGYV